MKILYVLDDITSIGGIKRITSEKARSWIDDYGCDVTFVVRNMGGKTPYFPLHPAVRLVDMATPGSMRTSSLAPANLRRIAGYARRLAAVLKRERPDVVFVCSRVSVHKFLLPLLVRTAPIVLEQHSSYINLVHAHGAFSLPRRVVSSAMERVHRFVDARYDRVVFLNPDEQAHYGYANGVVIPNFSDVPPNPVTERRRDVVVAAGRLDVVKRFDLLLEVWSRVDDHIEGWRLEIHGAGPERDRLQRLIDRRPWTNPVALMGPTDRLPEVLESSAVYAMTSRTEAFPMVLVEAQAAGLPVVAFDVPTGPRHILSTASGALVPEGDVEAFVTELLALMGDETRRRQMEDAARRNAGRFERGTVMTTWHALVRELNEDPTARRRP